MMADDLRAAELQLEVLRRDVTAAQERLNQARWRVEGMKREDRERRRKPGLRLGISDDYAALTAGTVEFYYGYEVTQGEGDDEEWCFTAKLPDGREVQLTQSIVGDAAGLDPPAAPEEYLLAGIGLVFLLDQEYARAGTDAF